MDEINAVQYDIFKAFHAVCERLNLKYYLVHGSLLGALRYQGFFPMDDDIDVAMPRKDYDTLMEKGQEFIGDRFFIQSYLSENEYPLVFGKVRAKGTAFIQPVLSNCKINKGIYIDVFPIDNYPTKGWKRLYLTLKERFLRRRVNERLNIGVNESKNIKTKILQSYYRLVLPSWEESRKKLFTLYSNVPFTGACIVRGGKLKEIGISFELFGDPVKIQFEDIISYAPNKTGEYLELIYGDYMNYEPMGKDMVSASEVMISADIVDVQKSYIEYE